MSATPEPIVHTITGPVPADDTPPSKGKVASIWIRIDVAIISAVATFLGSVYTTNGVLFDSQHLEAAGIGAFLGLLYKLEGILNPTS